MPSNEWADEWLMFDKNGSNLLSYTRFSGFGADLVCGQIIMNGYGSHSPLDTWLVFCRPRAETCKKVLEYKYRCLLRAEIWPVFKGLLSVHGVVFEILFEPSRASPNNAH
jgi:hypothetical protein